MTGLLQGTAKTLPAILLLLTGCAGYQRHLARRSPAPLARTDRAYRATLQMRYLGVGGHHLKWGDDELLLAPLFSNPSARQVLVGRIQPRPALIERFIGPVADTRAILVGHAHYDHLLDVPHIATRHARRARIYGSRSVANILAGAGLAKRAVVLEGKQVGTAARAGAWVQAGARIRFMALRSEHAPHAFGQRLWDGAVSSPLKSLPPKAKDWKLGQTLAYLIDFLDAGGRPAVRLLYHDAACSAPLGMPPRALLAQKPVDVVILCVPSYDEVSRYPEAFVAGLAPRLTVLGHWENFFLPPTDPLEPVPGLDVDAFLDRLRPALPRRGKLWLPKVGDRWHVSGDT